MNKLIKFSGIFNRKMTVESEIVYIKLLTNDFQQTDVIFHGSCHGCIIPSLSTNLCKECDTYDGVESINFPNWGGESNFMGYNDKVIQETIGLYRPKFIDKFPEMFI